MLILALLLLNACTGSDSKVSEDQVHETAQPVEDADGDGLVGDEDCDDHDPEVGGPVHGYVDADGDDYGDPEAPSSSCDPDAVVLHDNDCDDANAEINPGAGEACDGVDNDCDGLVDDADDDVYDPLWVWPDEDDDGYGADGARVFSCTLEDGYVLQDGDCDDHDASVSPDAMEVCDGIDDDCDTLIDDDDSGAVGGDPWYIDRDDDDWGDTSLVLWACEQPVGYAADGGDCDDFDEDRSPGAEEICADGVDQDCDGEDPFCDRDGDGYPDPEDCDDGDAAVYPGAVELDNGIDDDCDGTVDEGYGATDGDGDGWSEDDGDCDDADDAVYPGATEIYDGVDQDCDGEADDGVYPRDCAEILAVYPDADTGTYTIDIDGDGGAAAFSVGCQMDIDGGGWTAAVPDVVGALDASSSREYLYSYDSAWYRSPVTSDVWDWARYQALDGAWSYSSGSVSAEGSFSCTAAEDGGWGVGCSNGPGGTSKVLPIYEADPASATSMICQDSPDVFKAGACRSGVSIWVRDL